MSSNKETGRVFTGATPEELANAPLRPVQSRRQSSDN